MNASSVKNQCHGNVIAITYVIMYTDCDRGDNGNEDDAIEMRMMVMGMMS